MKKKSTEEFATKAERREAKRRPRMRLSGAALRTPNRHAGKKLSAR